MLDYSFDPAAVLAEVRQTAQAYSLSKWELYGLIAFIVLAWRLPDILRHRREMVAIRTDFANKSVKLRAQLERQRAKREKRSGSKK